MLHIPLTLIDIDPGGCHLMMHARVNGFKANILIDTGASMSIMDLSRIEKYIENPVIRRFDKFFTGMGAGKIEAFMTSLPEISLGGLCLRDKSIVLIDMSEINSSFAVYDLPRIDMVMGGDLLLELNAVVDYPGRCLILGPANQKP